MGAKKKINITEGVEKERQEYGRVEKKTKTTRGDNVCNYTKQKKKEMWTDNALENTQAEWERGQMR